MGVCVERLPGESIVVATLCGSLTVDAVRAMFVQTAALMQDDDGPIYRIANFLNCDVSFKSMASVITETTRLRPYGTRDSRIHPLMVCGHNRMRFIPDLMRRKEFGSIDVPVFDTLDEAVGYARAQLERKPELISV